jgi:hypothetical protein
VCKIKREIKKGNTKMFEVIARNHFHTVEFDEFYLEKEYAVQSFETARKCVDCEYAMLLDALTGEIIRDYDGVAHKTEIYE